MSKTTKIIAALGVVAGLGVAALPAFTFADGPSVQGDVELNVEVSPAIAMTITGNNDAHATDAIQYTAVTPVGTEDPSDEGWYEWSTATGAFVETADTSVVEGKKYYEQSTDTTGVDVFAPYSAGAGSVDGHAEAFKIGPSSSTLSILPNSVGTMTSTVTVYTNNHAGYKLTVKDSDTTTALTSTESSIPASATTTAGTAGWSIAGGDLEASAIVSSEAAQPLVVKNTNSKTSGGDATTMTYTVATASAQETGTYTDTITYTATCN